MTTPPTARLALALLTAGLALPIAGLALPIAGHAAPTPSYVSLSVPNAASTEAYGINDQGQVVGGYSDAAGNLHGFGLADGVFYTADIPGASDTVATGVSGDEVVGYYDVKYNDPALGAQTAFHGFVLTRNGYAPLDVPGADPGTTLINGIDAKDEIAGSYSATVASPFGPYTVAHGFVLKRGVYTTLDDPSGVYTGAGGLNTKGQVVGTYLDGNDNEQGFLLSGGRYVSLYGPADSFLAYANGINEAGQIVGYSRDANTLNYSGFTYSHGAYAQIAYPGAEAYTFPNGINSKGVIVGSYSETAGVSHGFVYTPKG